MSIEGLTLFGMSVGFQLLRQHGYFSFLENPTQPNSKNITNLSSSIQFTEKIPELKNDSSRIYTYALEHKQKFCDEAHEQSADKYIRPFESGLPRALQFTQTNRVIIHLNREKHGDAVLGAGDFKKIVKAIELESLKIFASASFKNFTDNEPGILMQFQGIPGFVQIHHIVEYNKKTTIQNTNLAQNTLLIAEKTEAANATKQEKKKRMLLEFYNEGDLFDKLQADIPMTKEDTKQVFDDLVRAVAILHNKEYLHRDLKTENIFLNRENETAPLHAFLGDLGLACRVTDEKAKNKTAGTLRSLSPEYAKSYLIKKTQEAVTTKAHDIWSLGLILSELLNCFNLPWMSGNPSKNELLKMIIAYIEPPEPQKNSPEHLAWSMLRKDPNQRITAEEAVAQLENLKWLQQK